MFNLQNLINKTKEKINNKNKLFNIYRRKNSYIKEKKINNR